MMVEPSRRPHGWRMMMMLLLLGIWLLSWLPVAQCAFVEFIDCLDETVQTSTPRLLQFVPLNISAVFNTNGSAHLLNITHYGNVTGQVFNGTYPSPDDPSWNEPNSTFGKIVDVEDGADLATTLFASYNVLTYTPYTARPARFCENVVNEACPLGPAFYRNSSDILDLPGYTVAHDLQSSYAFTTISVTTRIQSGLQNGSYYGCVTAHITPDLGSSLKGLLTYLPLAILIMVGVATVSAAIFSPWSSLDVFHWSSNYGRDEDVLRLVTPGFGDCLQYLQFVVFTGSLSLQYPGFYAPVVSRLGWSSLLFNMSLVTGGNGTTPIVDGIYQYRHNSKQGLDRMTQLIGMTSPSDAWADMMVWLVVLTVCVMLVTQIGFLLQWIYRKVKDVAREDLRSKNWYFSVGNVVRITLGYFLLPLVTLSMYQFVIASLGPTYAVALAAVVLALIIAFTAWLTYLFIRTRPRSWLFDDLQTVLLYGPLYNTYTDDTATFALVPILVNFLRGIAIGAVQQSGVAQIVLLAISEVVFILTLNNFRPYAAATSMHLYHTCFSVLRLVTIMLAITFVPSLGVSSSSRGWIGYVILLIHACVLVFGFFLNALQTLVEVIARLAGAGATGGRDAARGGLVKVFGMRQLSKRLPRRDAGQTASMGSNAQMLAAQHDGGEMAMASPRTRSISASSNLLLDANQRKSASHAEGSSQGRQTPDGMSTFSRLSKNITSPRAIVGLAKTESKDPYYRPPRRNTNDFMTATGRPRLSMSDSKQAEQALDDAGEASSSHRIDKDELEENGAELTKTKTDYAVREVDFYYGVRGGPLSGSGGTRKMRTGPADPTGPVSSARGWFKGLMGGKTKEKGKGFEVVRSAKAPQVLLPPTPEVENKTDVPYHDEPNNPANGVGNDDVSPSAAGELHTSPIPRAPTRPPMLPALDTMTSIELPSRIGSEASRKRRIPADDDVPAIPPVPCKSSRRGSSPASNTSAVRAPPAAAAPLLSPTRGSRDPLYMSSSQRLPFAGTSSSQQNRHSAAVSEVSSYMDDPVPDEEPVTQQGQPPERPGSVGFVNHHRASDNIRYSPDEAQIPRLSTVEYGYQPTQQGQTQTPDTPWTPAWNGSSAYNSGAGTQRFSRFRD